MIVGDFREPPLETRVAGNPAPDPGAAQERIRQFEAEHLDALLDPAHVGHRQAVAERNRLYRAAFGDGANTPLDVSSDGAAEPIDPADHAALIGRVFERYGALGEDAKDFAGRLAAAGITAADVAGIAEQVASSRPLSHEELLARVGRADLAAAGEYLADRPELDELIAERELWRWPAVIRELARRQREGRR